MRDGNALGAHKGVERLPGSEPTYEGWKLHLVILGTVGGEGSEPTYEGWKQLLHLRPIPRYNYVPSLPMRDGNAIATPWKTWVKISVPSLPMRDGNRTCEKEHASAEEVPSLPMRDGNSSYSALISSAVRGSEPTYEGWKPLPLWFSSPKLIQFRAYL